MAGNRKMMYLAALCLILACLLQLSEVCGGSTVASGWLPSLRSGCRGTVAECLGDEEEEFEVDSESNRRILATARRYISYGALQRNTVPCSRRGVSYYNCRPAAQANPYRRGCAAITRCRN